MLFKTTHIRKKKILLKSTRMKERFVKTMKGEQREEEVEEIKILYI
jgi:hypothetical protein